MYTSDLELNSHLIKLLCGTVMRALLWLFGGFKSGLSRKCMTQQSFTWINM